MFYYDIVCNIHGMKFHVDYYNELIALSNFYEGVEKSEYHGVEKYIVDSITIKSVKGKTIKLKKGMMACALSTMIKEYITTQELKILSKDADTIRIPKVSLYNKRFIQCLFPLFKYLKNYNPELSNIDLYNFLREFIIILGFDFETAYPNSVGDSEPFKSYFSNLK